VYRLRTGCRKDIPDRVIVFTRDKDPVPEKTVQRLSYTACLAVFQRYKTGAHPFHDTCENTTYGRYEVDVITKDACCQLVAEGP
jgi:CO dehydrogenase/acetyl-CoA synthase alpha subunit